eukprot:CAMPEP_0170480716 /NCGR_PEP_ID=MMETSP0208-20121228/1449_1 /TAXON_ID=197538 /ORGANISM="Strombidium inclinatum, Strain S3" /LENGTH=88 /DNA_ID=CAMNT_0010753307 /DNA_START=1157 /DNA_END=1423 /DNA_ORIENTATION=+
MDQSILSSLQGSPDNMKKKLREIQKMEEQDLADQLDRIDSRIQQAYMRQSVQTTSKSQSAARTYSERIDKVRSQKEIIDQSSRYNHLN